MTDTTLTLDRDIAARPETIWRCMTDPDLLPRWFAPDPVTVTHAAIDPTPGGAFHVIMNLPEIGEMDGGAGCILLADAPHKLVWSTALHPGFGPAPPAPDGGFHFTAILSLSVQTQTTTRYTATVLHADAAACAAHAAMGFDSGWGTMADQLARLAETL